MPPASAHLALMPVPAPPPMIAGPRTCAQAVETLARVKKLMALLDATDGLRLISTPPSVYELAVKKRWW